MTKLNPRWVTQLHATLPENFEEKIAGRVAYDIEGNKICLSKDALLECEASFREEELYGALFLLFSEYPLACEVILEPR